MTAVADVDRERKDRAETLRLTLLAAPVEMDGFDLLRLAHWVHTGSEPPPLAPTELNPPDTAQWTTGPYVDGMR